jgi:hypothetical protein
MFMCSLRKPSVCWEICIKLIQVPWFQQVCDVSLCILNDRVKSIVTGFCINFLTPNVMQHCLFKT